MEFVVNGIPQGFVGGLVLFIFDIYDLTSNVTVKVVKVLLFAEEDYKLINILLLMTSFNKLQIDLKKINISVWKTAIRN